MRRIGLVLALGLTLCLSLEPLAAAAQQGKVYKVGMLMPADGFGETGPP
jgi:hypothetical protein